MDPIDRKEPLEAGADGAFDLGDPSPPPSPRSRVKVVNDGIKSAGDGVKSANDGVKSVGDGVKYSDDGAKSVDDGVKSGDDRVKSGVDGVKSTDDGVKSGDDGCPKADTPVTAAGDSPPSSSREIEDDWEKIDVQQDEGGEQPLVSPGRSTDGALDDFKDAVETLRPHVEQTESSEGAEKPVVAAAAAAAATDPLAARKTSYIAAGLSSVRLPMVFKRSRSRGEDSDGEEDFHDAYASATDLVKDAGKAREMKAAGNEHYKHGDFEDAVDYYTMALHYCPEDDDCLKDRAVYFANRAQGHLRLKEYKSVVEDCTAALELDPHYVKALLRRAQANEHLEKYDVALEDAKALVEIDPSLQGSKETVTRLEKLQTEKNDKMKEEALGKLKELGNSLLGNFGLSMDNFKMQQDPDSGSYSINFER